MARRYFLSFNSLSHNLEWSVELYDSEFTGTPSEIDGTPSGFTLSLVGEDEDPHAPIVGGEAAFSLMIHNSSQIGIITALAGARQGRFHMVVRRGGADEIYWAGIVHTGRITYPDNYYPFFVNIQASCGIAQLKDVDYLDAAGARYTGRVTMLQHLKNIIRLIGVAEVDDMPAVRLRSNLNWHDAEMDNTADPAGQMEVEHSRFYGTDEEGNEFSYNALEVLTMLVGCVGARFYQAGGCWHLMQIAQYTATTQKIYEYDADMALVNTVTAMDYNIAVDYTTPLGLRKLSGGIYGFLPGLKKVCVDYQHITNTNRAAGFKWPEAGAGYVELPWPVVVDADNTTRLECVFNFRVRSVLDVNTSFNIYPIHRYKLRVYLKIGDHYLHRYQIGDFYNWVTEDSFWTTGEDYIDTQSPIVNQYNNGSEVDWVVKVSTAYLKQAWTNGENIEIKVSLHQVEGPSGVEVTEPTGPYYEGSLDWWLRSASVVVADEGLGENPDLQTLRHCAMDEEEGNTEKKTIPTWLGDGPAPHSVSAITVGGVQTSQWQVGGTGATFTLSQLLAREVLAARKLPLRVFDVAMMHADLHPWSRIEDDGTFYMPMSFELDAFNNVWSGRLLRVARDTVSIDVPEPWVPGPGGLTDDPIVQNQTPGTTANPFPDLEGLSGFVSGTVAIGEEAVATLTADVQNGSAPTLSIPAVVKFPPVKQGDTIKLVNLSTGTVETLTVSATPSVGATTITTAGTLSYDYPIGSVVKLAKQSELAGRGFSYKAFDQSTGFTDASGYTDWAIPSTVGSLPNPSTVGTSEIDRRLTVIRSGVILLYSSTARPGCFSVIYETNKIRFWGKLRDELVQIKVN